MLGVPLLDVRHMKYLYEEYQLVPAPIPSVGSTEPGCVNSLFLTFHNSICLFLEREFMMS